MSRYTLAIAALTCVVPALHAQDDKVYRTLSLEATETLLKDLKIDFAKSVSKRGDETYFEYKRDNYKIRLTQYSPTELMLDCVFRGIPLEKVNAWNTTTRFSRASYHKDTSGEFTILEYSLDVTGGVTAGAFKQFVARFDDELKKYERFVNNNVADDNVLASVGNDKIENILKTEAITFNKKINNAGVMMFDFEINGSKLRLYNFGGKDLMIDVHFKRISLEDANRYNLSKKFVRVVNYKGKDLEYTALEANLDCEAGVSEGMIRNWITSFAEDARDFAEYTKKLQK